MVCERKKCVWHRDVDGCVLSKNENFYYAPDGTIEACLNYITDKNDLSPEGKIKLKERYGNERDIISR